MKLTELISMEISGLKHSRDQQSRKQLYNPYWQFDISQKCFSGRYLSVVKCTYPTQKELHAVLLHFKCHSRIIQINMNHT